VQTFKRIVCAIDLTKASANAFDRALSLARASGARLYVLHAVLRASRSPGSRANGSSF
jgi:nucleotide-binding universal stress UspA family protein